ncbi:MAG: type II toxin-antitoxin system MqsA family antitoxin [Spirochaetes bacterium]|nr:type II toxin-antitoxin system MqsA family antitoxin [Spirochaetota bacterium]
MGSVCQVCGSENTELVVQDQEFSYKGHTLVIKDYQSTLCHNCGESIEENESYEKSIPLLRDFHRSVDGYLTGNEIRTIRKSFNMTQDEFSSVLGGGEKAFARYETGRVMQSKPMDNLLRILRDFPESISTLAAKSTLDGCSFICEDEVINYSPIRNPSPFNYVLEYNHDHDSISWKEAV